MLMVTMMAVTHSGSPPSVASTGARPLTLEGIIGLGTPIGTAGVLLDVALGERWSVAAGAGLGGGGPQVAVMSRLRAAGHPTGPALVIGAGVSGGPYQEFTIDADHSDLKTWTPALWANGELGFRYSTRSVVFRVSLGTGQVLNVNHFECKNAKYLTSCERERAAGIRPFQLFKTTVPYVAVAVGYRLPILEH
jgi:hypothetical protein